MEQEKSEYQQAINKSLGKKYFFFGNRLKSMNKRRNVNNLFSQSLCRCPMHTRMLIELDNLGITIKVIVTLFIHNQFKMNPN